MYEVYKVGDIKKTLGTFATCKEARKYIYSIGGSTYTHLMRLAKGK